LEKIVDLFKLVIKNKNKNFKAADGNKLLFYDNEIPLIQLLQEKN